MTLLINKKKSMLILVGKSNMNIEGRIPQVTLPTANYCAVYFLGDELMLCGMKVGFQDPRRKHNCVIFVFSEVGYAVVSIGYHNLTVDST
jgi:hypothetical protein